MTRLKHSETALHPKNAGCFQGHGRAPWPFKRRRLLKTGQSNSECIHRSATEGPCGGSPIKGYVVEDHADDELGEFETQDEAIKWAKSTSQMPNVARVRHLDDKRSRTNGEQHEQRWPLLSLRANFWQQRGMGEIARIRFRSSLHSGCCACSTCHDVELLSRC